jgi:hypothetical protein
MLLLRKVHKEQAGPWLSAFGVSFVSAGKPTCCWTVADADADADAAADADADADADAADAAATATK